MVLQPLHVSMHQREFFCGWGAAFINICVTFPINKVMFRQMVHGVRARKAFEQLRREGFNNLYRGLLPPLIAKTASCSLMFGSYATYRDFLTKRNEWIRRSPTTSLCLAAFLAGSTEAVLLCPFERVQMILQAREFHGRYQNTFHAFRDLRNYGLKEYYRGESLVSWLIQPTNSRSSPGLTPILARNGPSNILFFSLRDTVKHIFPATDVVWQNLVENFVTGALLGAFISTVFYPINVIRTKMQTVPIGSKFLSISEAARLVYEERNRSLRKIYYGVHINYTRALISWGIINAR